MADNKVFIRRKFIRPSADYSSPAIDDGLNLVRLKADVSSFRDNFRSGFPDTSRYVVSDIAQWDGVSGIKGLAFIFRDKTMGCEWLFSFGCATANYTSVYLYGYMGTSGPDAGSYYQTANTSNVSNPGSSTNAVGAIHFNHDYTSTYAMGFDDAVNLTYTLGDYQAPASNPRSALSSFMPSATGRIKSYYLDNWSTSLAAALCYIYYPEKGTLSFDMTYGGNRAYYITMISGKHLYKSNADGGLANPADTRRDGAFVIQRLTNNSNFGSFETSAYMFNAFVRHDGTTIEMAARPANILNDFNRSNYLSGGLVQKRKLQISVPSYIKGYLDPEIVNESFPYNDSSFNMIRLALPDADNPMIHDHPQLTRFWKKDLVPFMALTESDLPTS